MVIIDPDLSIGRRPIGPDRAGDKQTKGKDKNAAEAGGMKKWIGGKKGSPKGETKKEIKKAMKVK